MFVVGLNVKVVVDFVVKFFGVLKVFFVDDVGFVNNFVELFVVLIVLFVGFYDVIVVLVMVLVKNVMLCVVVLFDVM